VLVAVVAWLAVGVLALASGPPLGHDEAAYAVAARGDAPAWHYRSTGMIAIARAGLALGGSECVLRALALALSVGVLIAAYALGRAAFSSRTGAWAAAVLATAHPMAARSAELIGDLPATACLLAGVAVLIGELERERIRWRLMWAAPLFAAAFYVRYGSAPVIALVAVLALVLYAERLACAPVAATVALTTLLVVPHFAWSLHTTGSLFGILAASASMPRRAYLGEGLVSYLTANPFWFYGALVAPVMVAGLAALRSRRRAGWFVVALALGQIVMLGLESHAQPRYVFFATALLVIAGVDVLREIALPRLAVATIALAWLGIAILIVPYDARLARQRHVLYAAAEAIRKDAAGQPCAIAANVAPQLIWATRCDVVIAKSAPKLYAPWPDDATKKYVVSIAHAVIAPALLEAVAATAHGAPHELVVASPDAHVWRLD